MKVLKYPAISHADVAFYWKTYFKDKTTLLGDYDLALLIEKSLFEFGVQEVSVLVFLDDTNVRGILPLSYDSKKAWCYYPSYIFISPEVTMDAECWNHMLDVVPKPFIMYETSIKTVFDLCKLKIPWLTFAEANVVDLTKYRLDTDPFNCYLNALDKKTRSKFRNCLNRNQDLQIKITQEFNESHLHKAYRDYCNSKFEDTFDFTYFKNQLELFPSVFETASRLGQLITLQIFLEDELVALNYSIFDGTCLYDYICYRETNPELEKRSLGTFAILKNIQFLLDNHKATTNLYYDLASEFSYKKQFLPYDSSNQYIKLFLN
jgi:hypothetical protein